ncbi:M48 family metallopeptidase [Kiloniella sp. b19]|uniref:M48 family metallopeptidase n=1 Tax=Kiloniella sp. GXU_MW_B19 TaxID=3141326 RepID=UPI0031D229AA
MEVAERNKNYIGLQVEGLVYQAGSSSRSNAVLIADGDRFVLKRMNWGEDEIVRIDSVSTPFAGQERQLHLSNGFVFHTTGVVPSGFLPKGAESGLKAVVYWFEEFNLVKAALMLCIVVGFILGLRWGTPLLADYSVAYVPATWDQSIGRSAFEQSDGTLFEPSELSMADQERIRSKARGMISQWMIQDRQEASYDLSSVDILFRSSPALGANALAFSGGPIVVTDQLVELFDNDGAVVAVIAHEYGHVLHRHGMRQTLRYAGLILAATLVFGADESLLEELLTIGIAAETSSYSRGFEREADAFAVEALKAAHLPVSDALWAMQKLAEDCGASCEGTGWFDSHPGMDERLQMLEEALQ